MKRMFKKTLATVVAIATMAVGIGNMSANAANVGSGSASALPKGLLDGNIYYSLSSPAPGINVYTITAIFKFSGYTSEGWTQHTRLSLVCYPSGDECQSDSKEGSTASVSGVCTGMEGRAYASYEIRGTHSGVIYIASDIVNI